MTDHEIGNTSVLPSAPDYVVPERYLEAAKRRILPPEIRWNGESQKFLVGPEDPWITPAEATSFCHRASYAETIAYIERLAATSALVSISYAAERSGEGRLFPVVVVSKAPDHSARAVRDTGRPTIFVEAGIHPGECCGTDAGLMLVRDLTVAARCTDLLDYVDLIFAPIVNADGHERAGPYGRLCQRGPDEAGWRNNAANINLNRDFVKADGPELRNVLRIFNEFDPAVFIDIHATDGANYAYDVTYSHNGRNAWSPMSARWMDETLRPHVDSVLGAHGHVPALCIDVVDGEDITKGFYPYYTDGPRYSNAYADARQVAGMLLEIHAPKPYLRQVLGTYTYLKAVLEIAGNDAAGLLAAVTADRTSRPARVPLTFKERDEPEIMDFRGMTAEKRHSVVTGDEVTLWSNEEQVYRAPILASDVPDVHTNRPQAYYVPSQWPEAIERLRWHGIQCEDVDESVEIDVTVHRIEDVEIAVTTEIDKPYGEKLPLYEGRLMIRSRAVPERRLMTYHAGSVRVPTDQDLGTLAVILLDPDSPDSLLSWGFFNTAMTASSISEPYIMVPMAEAMLAESSELKEEFEAKLAENPDFAKDRAARIHWFFERTPFADQLAFIYPVGQV